MAAAVISIQHPQSLTSSHEIPDLRRTWQEVRDARYTCPTYAVPEVEFSQSPTPRRNEILQGATSRFGSGMADLPKPSPPRAWGFWCQRRQNGFDMRTRRRVLHSVRSIAPSILSALAQTSPMIQLKRGDTHHEAACIIAPLRGCTVFRAVKHRPCRVSIG